MKNILITEDDPILLNALKIKLEKQKYNVFTAVNGQAGLEIALESHPDLILLDLIMPVMDGMTMLRKLRETDSWGKTVPVVILTNLSGDSNQIINDVTDLEPSYYLTKADLKLDELLEKIKEVLVKPAEIKD